MGLLKPRSKNWNYAGLSWHLESQEKLSRLSKISTGKEREKYSSCSLSPAPSFPPCLPLPEPSKKVSLTGVSWNRKVCRGLSLTGVSWNQKACRCQTPATKRGTEQCEDWI